MRGGCFEYIDISKLLLYFAWSVALLLCVDFSDALDVAIVRHLHICTTVHSSIPHIFSNTTHPYHTLVTTGVKAMRTFVPESFHRSFANPCWFETAPNLPESIHTQFTKYRGCIPKVEEIYTYAEAKGIVKMAQTTQPKCSKNYNLTNRVIPPKCTSTISLKCLCKHQLYCLPRVMLAGFPKCATTSLYYMLVKHPEIAPSRIKETHFWRDTFISTTKIYKQVQTLYYIYHFECSSLEMIQHPNHLTIDGSTTTMFPGLHIEIFQDKDMCVIPRMLTELIPSVKFIIMMRNPANRVYSDFWYICSKFYWKKGRKVTVPDDYLANGTRLFHQASLKMITEFQECAQKRSVFECVRRAGMSHAHTASWLKFPISYDCISSVLINIVYCKTPLFVCVHYAYQIANSCTVAFPILYFQCWHIHNVVALYKQHISTRPFRPAQVWGMLKK